MTPITNYVRKFEDFFRHFQMKNGIHKYNDRIKQIQLSGGGTLRFFYEDLFNFDPQLAEKLKDDLVPILDYSNLK